MMARAHRKGLRLARLAPLLLFAAAGAMLRAQTTQQQQQTDVTTLKTDYSSFNLISLGTTSLSSFSDTQGGLAVNGNLTLDGSGSIATQPGNVGTNSNPSLYVTGSLSLNSTVMINSGYASLPGLSQSQWTWNASQDTLTGSGGAINSTNAGTTRAGDNPITNPGPSGWNWSNESSSLSTVSTSLADATATGTIGVQGQNLTFTAPNGQTTGVVVFSLNANNISGDTYNGQQISNIQIDVPTGLTYVINVIDAGGKTLFGSGINFNSGSDDSQLLWNFEGSGTVTLANGGDFYGSILAPSATVSTTSIIDGQVASDGFTDTGVEMHDDDAFNPTVVATPEPSTYALWAVAVCACGIAARRVLRLRVRRAALA
jgi:choice-of-anchor A domain-containing protein